MNSCLTPLLTPLHKLLPHPLESSRLRRIHLSYDSDRTRPDHKQTIHDVISLLHLPQLQDLDIQAVEYDASYLWPFGKPYASALQSLTLSGSHLFQETLAALLTCTPNLKVFRYYFLCEYDFKPRRPCRFDGDAFVRSLCHLRTTLETLVLSVAFCTAAGPSAWPAAVFDSVRYGLGRKLGSLAEFERLKHLEVPRLAFYGWDPDDRRHLIDLMPPRLGYLVCNKSFIGWPEYTLYQVGAAWQAVRLLQRRGCVCKFESFKRSPQ